MSPVVHFHTLLSYNCHFFIFLLLYKLHGGDHVLLHVWSITHTQSCPFYCFLCLRRLHLFLGNYPKPELSHGQGCMWWSGIESMSSFIFMLMTFWQNMEPVLPLSLLVVSILFSNPLCAHPPPLPYSMGSSVFQTVVSRLPGQWHFG